MENNFGLVHVLWGNGKGKTTSAVGLGLRAVGHGFKVHLIQFMKGGVKGHPEYNEYGEVKAIKKFQNFTYEKFGIDEWVTKENLEKHRAEALKGVESAKNALSGNYDVVILDEILYAVLLNVLKTEEVIDLIKNKGKNTELILTGGHKPIPEIIELADYVTEIRKEKHPYDKGIQARIGIEY